MRAEETIRLNRNQTTELIEKGYLELELDLKGKLQIMHEKGHITHNLIVPKLEVRPCRLDERYCIEFAYHDNIYFTPDEENVCTIYGDTHQEFLDKEDCLKKFEQMEDLNEKAIERKLPNTYIYLRAYAIYHGNKRLLKQVTFYKGEEEW